MHFLAKKFQKKERKIKFSNTEALGVCAQVEGAVLHHVAAEVTSVHRVLVHQAPVGLDLKLINRVNDLCDGIRFSRFAHLNKLEYELGIVTVLRHRMGAYVVK